jgi:hypothetical protein
MCIHGWRNFDGAGFVESRRSNAESAGNFTVHSAAVPAVADFYILRRTDAGFGHWRNHRHRHVDPCGHAAFAARFGSRASLSDRRRRRLLRGGWTARPVGDVFVPPLRASEGKDAGIRRSSRFSGGRSAPECAAGRHHGRRKTAALRVRDRQLFRDTWREGTRRAPVYTPGRPALRSARGCDQPS